MTKLELYDLMGFHFPEIIIKMRKQGSKNRYRFNIFSFSQTENWQLFIQFGGQLNLHSDLYLSFCTEIVV